MIDKRSALTVLVDNNTTFTEYSHKLASFGKDAVTMSVANATDYLYIGFDKPVNAFYIDITTANGSEGSLTFEYYNGSTWVDCVEKSDDTLGFFRSGFVRWERQTDHVENSVNSMTSFWVRAKPSVDRTNIVLSGLNLVFSDDHELSLISPSINDSTFLGDEFSHIKTHSAVKIEIIQKFRNKDYIKVDADGNNQNINCWDLHDIDEVRLAATYLALSMIYYSLSDNPEDVWEVKSQKYEEKYEKYINLARLSVDLNDDGVVDDVENKPTFRNVIMRR